MSNTSPIEISTVIALIALALSLATFFTNRHKNRVEGFRIISELDHHMKLSESMDVIRSFEKTYAANPDPIAAYNQFMAEIPDEYVIRRAVDFFNRLGHLERLGYFSRQDVMLLYLLSLQDCHRNLSWWLKGFRAANGDRPYYTNYERLTTEASKLQYSPDGKHIIGFEELDWRQ